MRPLLLSLADLFDPMSLILRASHYGYYLAISSDYSAITVFIAAISCGKLATKDEIIATNSEAITTNSN